MFEKEAEEIVNKSLCSKIMCYGHCSFSSPKHHRCGDWHRCYEIAKKGAEFGYNKANEWHYVKDGINPTHSYRVLVFTDEGVGFGIYGLDDKKWHTYDTGFEVIAWKEIVLPELPKESE